MEFINSKNVTLKTNEKVACIYIITNKVNNKVYIGQTTNFRKHLSDYRNYHKKKAVFPIQRAIHEFGTENFTIDILEICTPTSLTAKENKYIRKYDSTNEAHGYNIIGTNMRGSNDAMSRMLKSIAHTGMKDSANAKRSKSNPIIAITGKTVIAADSAKLFGDFLGVGKDLIKNGLRQPCQIQGYQLYYDDYNRRQEIRKKVLNKARVMRNKQYIILLDILDKIEDEGVETIYRYFNEVYTLEYRDGEDKCRLRVWEPEEEPLIEPEPEFVEFPD